MGNYDRYGNKKKGVEDPKASTLNSRRRILATGNPVPELKKEKATVLGKAVIGTLNNLDRPRNAVMTGVVQAGINSNPAKAAEHKPIYQAAAEGFKRKTITTGSGVLKNLGVKNKTAQFVGGMVIDSVLDPTMYVTPGLGSFAKGAVRGTGATLTKDTAKLVSKQASTTIYDASKAKILKQHNVADVEKLAAKLGTGKDEAYNMINKEAFGPHFDEAQKAMPGASSYKIAEAAKRRYGESQIGKYQESVNMKAGKGMTAFGKTIATGAQMQDAGAAFAAKITKNKYAGAAAEGVSDTAKAVFSTKARGLDGQSADILKAMQNKKTGNLAMRTMLTSEMGQDVAAVQMGVTYKGTPIEEVIESAIVNNKAGLTPADLNTVITTTPAQKFAAKRLASKQSRNNPGFIVDPDNMTLGELINLYSRQYMGMAIDETRQGLMKGSAIRQYSTNVAGRIAAGKQGADYAARVRAIDDKILPKGGVTGQLSVSNAFASKRKDQYQGMTSAEINADIREGMKNAGAKIDDDYKFLEEDALKALVTRQMSSDRMLADKEFVNQVLGTFGERIPQATPDMIKYYKSQGMAIVIPKAQYNLFSVGENISELNPALAPVIGGGKRAIIKSQQSFDALKSLSSEEANNLIVQMGRNAQIYAVPVGVVDHVNRMAVQQVDAGMSAITKALGKFYRVWKPAVTGMRPAYHARNMASSAFNNFLALGKDMFAPDVQKMAAAVATVGRGTSHWADDMVQPIHNAAINIRGKNYTAKDIHKMMVENNALSTFMLTDANDLSKAVINDVGHAQGNRSNFIAQGFKSWAATGKAVGNTTEEYVRTVNFVAHLKRGFSPEDAAEMVNKYHFDYQDLTEVEQAIKGIGIPFYTWLRKNLPLQLESFLNDPRVYQTLNKATMNGSEVQEINYDNLPQYIQKNMGVPIGKNADGRTAILDPGLPVGDLQTGWKDILLGSNPLIKGVYESLSGQSMLTGAPTRSFTGEESVDIVNYFGGKDKVPAWAQKALFSGGGIAATSLLKYAKNNSGVFRDMANFGPILADAPETQVVQQGRNYSRFNNVPAAVTEQFFDPNFMKYYSEEAGQRSADYTEKRQMENEIQRLKKLGFVVNTVDELNKRY